MATEASHNDPTTYTGALNRSLRWPQEHDRATPSAQASVEIPTQTPQEYVPDQSNGTVEPEPLPPIEPPSSEEVEIEGPGIETAELRKNQRPPRNSPLDPRRFQKPAAVNGPIDIPKHERRCCICRHPDRDAIEEGFLRWTRPDELRYEFKLPNRSCIYRHAHAFHLFEQRARYLRSALENIIEESANCKPSADSIIRAIRAYSCLDDQGRWVEPPRHLIISREPVAEQPLATSHPSLAAALVTETPFDTISPNPQKTNDGAKS